MVVERAFDLLAHKVGLAARICQRQVEKAVGEEEFRHVFSAFDAALQTALHSREWQADTPVTSSHQHDAELEQVDTTPENSIDEQSLSTGDAFYDQLKQEVCREIAGHSISDGAVPRSDEAQTDRPSVGGVSMSETEVDALVEDRLGCIRPSLKHELRRAVSSTETLPPAPRSSKLARDVAAHTFNSVGFRRTVLTRPAAP